MSERERCISQESLGNTGFSYTLSLTPLGKTVLENVPSWHHQAVSNVEGTRLTVTGTTDTNGVPVIEAVERKDKSFCLGVQFHPEVSVRRNADGSPDAAALMEYETARAFFEAIIEAGQEYEEEREADDAA